MSETRLKLLTLNCWGLKLPGFLCPSRTERIQAIGEELAKGEHSLVLLEEIWVQSDYDKLCSMVFKVLPHSHYFHSGMFGSGLCVFSKYPILETLQHRFAVNGYPSKLLHGDWYAAKSAGLVQLLFEGLRINVYIAHMLASYTVEGAYQVHQAVQAFEMSQFIKHTSEGCDAIIVAGDFNSRPSLLPYNLLLSNANLTDAWKEQRAARDDDVGATCDHPKNGFTTPSKRKEYPVGQRLDYVLFRNNGGCEVACHQCRVMMYQIPDSKVDFSDHQALSATLQIKKNVTSMAPERKADTIADTMATTLNLLGEGLRVCRRDQIISAVLFVIGLIVLVLLSNMDPGSVLGLSVGLPLKLGKLLLTLLIGGCGWYSIVLAPREQNIFMSAKKDMQHILDTV